MEQMITNRDFSSISPSAKWLLLMKGYTNIPFAREVAELMVYPDEYLPDFEKRDFTFWATTLGLENRYWSIDQLLNDLTIKNILELSSGYSFRGLDCIIHNDVHYIDTDLPDVILVKKQFFGSLKIEGIKTKGNLELLPLNALDEKNFHEIIDRFPDGEVAIINEGLLTYLDKQEKLMICSIIHNILMERGGYWITADIVLKNKEQKLELRYNAEIKEFNEKQDTEGNSFESFEEAEMFFKDLGFVIDKKAKTRFSEMSSFKYMLKSLTLRKLFKMKNAGNIFATWRLKAVLRSGK
jgi:O-methyltransferase involved in polyketide biosynthesis